MKERQEAFVLFYNFIRKLKIIYLKGKQTK